MCPQNLHFPHPHCSTVAGAFRLQAPEALYMEPANPPGSKMWLAGDGDGKVGVGVTRLQTQGRKTELPEVCSQKQTGNKLVQSQNANQR